jgi:hypothetical protein
MRLCLENTRVRQSKPLRQSRERVSASRNRLQRLGTKGVSVGTDGKFLRDDFNPIEGDRSCHGIDRCLRRRPGGALRARVRRSVQVTLYY